MWTKFIIVDNSVQRDRSRFSYGFGGYNTDRKEIWTRKPELVKLYDTEQEVVEEAKKLIAIIPILPVKVFEFNIDTTNHKNPSVNLTEIKIPLAVVEQTILNVKE
jgi:hypothetical protein